jgi:excisionase family DNA binding protein
MTKPEDAPRLDDWMTATEISDLLNVSRQTTNQMIKAGEFRSLHVIGPATKPQFLVRRAEVLEIQKTRTFPRSTPRGT